MTLRPFRSVCLDVTRLVSRVGAGPRTGIDRVEYAYLRELLSRTPPLFGLARTSTGFVMLNQYGLRALRARIDGTEPWGSADFEAKLSRRVSPSRRRAEADLRRFAVARSRKGGLSDLLALHLPAGALYLNTGHSNLDGTVFSAIRRVKDARSVVLVHDTIPLRRPDLQRPGTVARFDEKMSAVAEGADIVICSTEAERGHIEREIQRRGGRPKFVTAPLGIDVPVPGPFVQVAPPDGPFFAVVGTIEPRKNLQLLIRIWNRLADELRPSRVPGLCIIGRRGWEAPGTLACLDALKARCSEVREYSALDDGAKGAIVSKARALLFPTLDEGFGLPPLEALALGTPVVCSDLRVFRETMGNAPVYADPADMYHWIGVVRDLAGDGDAMRADVRSRTQGLVLPTWQAHINRVLSTIP